MNSIKRKKIKVRKTLNLINGKIVVIMFLVDIRNIKITQTK